MRHVEIGGLRLRVAVSGSRPVPADLQLSADPPPLLLISGLGANLELWDPLVAELSDRTTIAFDPPGTGFSNTPALPLGMGALARVVSELLDALDLRSVDVLGLSFGGAMAQQLVHQDPRVRRLVLAATMCGWGGLPGNLLALFTLTTPARFWLPGPWQAVAPLLYGESSAWPDRARTPSLRGYAYQIAAMATWSSLAWLHTVTQPTLVLAGSDDPIVPLVNAKQLASTLPNSRLTIIQGGGHLFAVDQPMLTATLLRDFLDADDPVGDDAHQRTA